MPRKAVWRGIGELSQSEIFEAMFASLDITRAGDPSTRGNIGEAIRMLEVVFLSVARLSLPARSELSRPPPSLAVTRHIAAQQCSLGTPG